MSLHEESYSLINNVRSVKKNTKHSSNTLLRLVSFFTERTLWGSSSKLYSIKPKLDIGLFVDFCVFTCFYQFLQDVLIIFFLSAEQFYENIMQELVKTGKYTEINKQSDVKF